MEKKNTYFGGVLIKNGIKTNIALGNYLYSDIELNPPKQGLFKRVVIKDCDKDYTIPSTIDGHKVIGFTHFLNGWSHHGTYRANDNFMFIPLSFFNVSHDHKYNGAYLPDISVNGKWHLDFFKVTLVSNGIIRTLRYEIYGCNWNITHGKTNETIDAFNFSLLDEKARKIISGFAGELPYIHESGFNKKTVDILKGYHPCFIRDDFNGPFIIEFKERNLLNDY